MDWNIWVVILGAIGVIVFYILYRREQRM